MILVSACLAGFRCRYDGAAKQSDRIQKLVSEGKAIPVCPEVLGGLPTPRCPAERRGLRVITREGKDVTAAFQLGAEETLRLARLYGADRAILKARSPSCGCGRVYDGSFSGKLTGGYGITAELLLKNGVTVEEVDE